MTASLPPSMHPQTLHNMYVSVYSLLSFSVCGFSLLVSSAASQLMMRCIHSAGGYAEAFTHKFTDNMPADEPEQGGGEG